jgi:hypothetical protein
MKNLNEKTYKELKDQLINQQVLIILGKASAWLTIERPIGDYIKSEKYVLAIQKSKDYKETEAFIEGYIKRIPEEMIF